MSEPELTCKEVVELVNDYLSATMTAADRARFADHLAECPACTSYLEQMKTTIELTGQLREDELSDDMKCDLVEAFRRWKK
jgi:predicted anti-sigma-YlaC factor YlaD